MDPLVALKEKLMIKPTIEERKRVEVVIKGTKSNQEKKWDQDTGTIIQIKTNANFDRKALLKKLEESKKLKVTVKPLVEQSQKTFEKEEKGREEEKGRQEDKGRDEKKKKAKKLTGQKPIIINEDEEMIEVKIGERNDIGEEIILKPKEKADEEPREVIPIKVSKKKDRITKKVEKGVAVLGPETIVEIGDTNLRRRIPKKEPPVIIKVSSYYMNNREKFVNFINSLFEPYRQELLDNEENISCDVIGKTSTNFSLLTHQKIVRDYLNLYTPYRGLLLYHGLGSGKTATSIGIAEGMKSSKQVIIMTPASLRANYVEELKKAGDLIYKRNQFWEWISLDERPEALQPMSAVLNLPEEYIVRHRGAFFINVTKPTNYDELNDAERKILEAQLNEMISTKYKFINYNGLRSNRLSEMTSKFTRNIFDNAVVVIDEAHNLISRIVNKLKKEKEIVEEESRGEEEENIFGKKTPVNLASKLYYMLLRAKNAKIVLLTGTPVINYPNEFAILFNILRGNIKTWKIGLNIKTSKKIDRESLQQMLIGEKTLDYLDYSPSSKILTITRNPFGFTNKIKKDEGYKGVSNVKKTDSGQIVLDDDFSSDDSFERKIIAILKRNDIEVIPKSIQVLNKKALPDDFDTFCTRYINDTDRKLKNVDALKRRIIGLSSYFKSAQESLLPKYNKRIGVDYHVIKIPMSDTQFKIYESARKEERLTEKNRKKPNMNAELFEEKASTYRIFSRLFCNFALPDRPIPEKKKKTPAKGAKVQEEKEGNEETSNITEIIKEGIREEAKVDIEDQHEGEIEGDEILDKIGGLTYKERIDTALINVKEHSNDFLTPEALQTYSPKFLHILENIQDPDYQGLHLVYSQFRTLEGIGLFCLTLEKNGFARFSIKKNTSGVWHINIPEIDQGKQTYALYTGTETSEEKEMIRHIYNGEWDDIPESISMELRSKFKNNNMGEVIKVFMITSSGSEGINLRNTRYVHIMEPYWHPVRLEQVIGRARRICSHKSLPKALQTVEVFVYLMVFTETQLLSDEAIELKRKDLSKAVPRLPQTSDQYLYEISEIKAGLTTQLTDAIKETAFDCYIYSNGKCFNFGDPSKDKFSYYPDYVEQQNDLTAQANKIEIEWSGKVITINNVTYVYRRINDSLLNIYDYDSYQAALKDDTINPLQIGTLEIDRGEYVFRQLVV